MCDELRVLAYAKVNFGLNILPKRADGYHNLESIFQTIDLFDELLVTKQNQKICTVICDQMELPEKNTLTSAFDAFSRITGKCDFGIKVKLTKGIPSGGGLGGGSSDGAALVKALEKFYQVKLSQEQLFEIAALIGSDVFFFTRCNDNGTGCALVSGRGEEVKNISGRNDLFLLVAFPKISSSTKLAYEKIDCMFESGGYVKAPPFSEYENIYNSSPETWSFVNTFTPVLKESYPEIADVLDKVDNTGALYTEVSGSGSTVFGIFKNEQQAESARLLLADTLSCKVCRTL